jgi:hypothetical protein
VPASGALPQPAAAPPIAMASSGVTNDRLGIGLMIRPVQDRQFNGNVN